MRLLDLCSGIGGFSLGMERAGMRTIGFCEIDPYCCDVLARHWPDVPIYHDIRELNAHDLRPHVITAGYPCQPFSIAGKQRGAKDDRHLWPEVLRIVKQCRPAWVVAENVGGHIRLGLDDVLFDLESEGYTARPVVIPACAINAPHRRDRVWIIGHADSDRQPNGTVYAASSGRMVGNPNTARKDADRTDQDEQKWRDFHQNNLTAQVFNPEKMIPTPSLQEHKNSSMPPSQATRDNLAGYLIRQGKSTGGHLNPQWVEWLMGYPIEYSDSKH